MAPWRAEDAYIIQFADARVDLRQVNERIGLYTIADHWKAAKRTAEQEQLFALLEVKKKRNLDFRVFFDLSRLLDCKAGASPPADLRTLVRRAYSVSQAESEILQRTASLSVASKPADLPGQV